MTRNTRELQIAHHTSLFAGDRFQPASPPSHTPRVSARAAFQQALHGRRLLVDIRPTWQRELSGEITDKVQPMIADVSDLPWLAAALVGSRPILICQQGNASIRLAAAFTRLGTEDVADVIGGFGAWLAAGLPVR